jgi:1-deoxy-D-xylulose 5-phosphate reductoisomerase
MKPKNVVLLGTTGSIGVSTQKVVAALLADVVLAILDEGMHR